MKQRFDLEDVWKRYGERVHERGRKVMQLIGMRVGKEPPQELWDRYFAHRKTMKKEEHQRLAEQAFGRKIAQSESGKVSLTDENGAPLPEAASVDKIHFNVMFNIIMGYENLGRENETVFLLNPDTGKMMSGRFDSFTADERKKLVGIRGEQAYFVNQETGEEVFDPELYRQVSF